MHLVAQAAAGRAGAGAGGAQGGRLSAAAAAWVLAHHRQPAARLVSRRKPDAYLRDTLKHRGQHEAPLGFRQQEAGKIIEVSYCADTRCMS